MTKYDSESGDYSFELDVKEAAADFGSFSDSYVMVSYHGNHHSIMCHICTANAVHVQTILFPRVDFGSWRLCH